MSNPRPMPYLPQEILDYIIDLLRDEPETLKQCCLVSKSWVLRTRTHLFSDIEFRSPDDLETWKKVFPDPARSPAYHTHSLFVGSLQAVTAADAEEGGWIRTFSNVVRLDVRSGIINLSESPGSLVPFHNLSPVLKSLRVTSRSLSSSQVFNLICSLPLLEDLSIRSHGMGSSDDDGTVFQPSTSPVLTGTLAIYLPQGMEYTTRRLFGLPNGLHFRKFVCTWCLGEDLRWITTLVEGCCGTLECVDIECCFPRNSWAASVDFSKATKLKEVAFRFNTLHAAWIVMALQTITHKHGDLKQISLYFPIQSSSISDPANIRHNIRQALGEENYSQWTNLDCLLVQFQDSYGIYTKAIYHTVREEEKGVCEYIRGLLPEVTGKGIIELVNSVDLDVLQ